MKHGTDCPALAARERVEGFFAWLGDDASLGTSLGEFMAAQPVTDDRPAQRARERAASFFEWLEHGTKNPAG